MTRADREPSNDRFEHLTGGDLLAGAGASWLALVASVALLLASMLVDSVPRPAVDEFAIALLVFMMYATLIWLAVIVVLGLPLAFWIERRMPVDAGLVRRFTPYVIAGAVVGAALYNVYPWMAPISVVCACTGRVGAGWWRSKRRSRLSGGSELR